MTYDRMQAKPLPGKHCHFCEQTDLPLVKTRCCQKWVCCDTDFISFRGGGRCQFEHEHYSICHFHHNNGHEGKWLKCDECRDFFGEQFKEESENPINVALE